MREGVQNRYRDALTRGPGSERIASYSDGIFGFAMTLLVIDVAIPPEAKSALHVLELQAPNFFAFALSFTIIGYVWMGHHREFRVIVRHDTALMAWNLVLLFLIACMPFPTAIISEFAPQEAAVIAYATAISLIMLVQMIVWWHVRRAGLLAPVVDRGLWLFVFLDYTPILFVFATSIPMALVWGGQIAMWWWCSLFVLAPLVGVMSARRIDRAIGLLPAPDGVPDMEVEETVAGDAEIVADHPGAERSGTDGGGDPSVDVEPGAKPTE